MIQENIMPISAATVGGAVLFGLVNHLEQGMAKNYRSTLVYAALGGLAGFTASVGGIYATKISKGELTTNWAIIGGSMGVALPLIYSTYEKYVQRKAISNKALLKRTVIGALTAGGIGTAATYIQRSF
tara:strand:+ start:330 stop:713 length:384 start_codon:yes stop_codon:yes gene_type:complete